MRRSVEAMVVVDASEVREKAMKSELVTFSRIKKGGEDGASAAKECW